MDYKIARARLKKDLFVLGRKAGDEVFVCIMSNTHYCIVSESGTTASFSSTDELEVLEVIYPANRELHSKDNVKIQPLGQITMGPPEGPTINEVALELIQTVKSMYSEDGKFPL